MTGSELEGYRRQLLALHDRLGITASTRASFYLYNTPAEVELLVDVVGKIRKRFRPQGRKRKHQ